MNFEEAITSCFSKYFVFSGRASRSEYWYWILFGVIIYILSSILDVIIFDITIFVDDGPIYYITSLILLIPGISVTARRLHDTGRSGWRILWSFTGIGALFVLYWLISRSDSNKNYYDKN